MIQMEMFTFNPFQENTYVLFDETHEAIIIDPGMYTSTEETRLKDFISNQNLKPIAIVNTHAHIDHVMGVEWCRSQYQIPFLLHKFDLVNLEALPLKAQMFGVSMEDVAPPDRFIEEGEKITFGNSELDIMFTPGHAPGHVVFIDHLQRRIIGGDVLFKGSVGRVDLPGCNPDDLVHSIREKLYKLDDIYQVFPGHGPSTTIGLEKKSNAFVPELGSSLL
jgi:hydroxyacylglutathione hydrolase